MATNKKKLLVVDDVPELARELLYLLDDEGYEVLSAKDGIDAMEVLSQHTVELLIADIFMPRMDGLELVAQVNEKYPDIKIIVITGGGRGIQPGDDIGYMDSVKHMGRIETVLKKPFDDQDLLDAINKVFEEA